jgi:hypothetical protein
MKITEESALVGPSDPDMCFDVYEQGTDAILLVFFDAKTFRPVWQTAGTYNVVTADLKRWLAEGPSSR